MKFKIKVYRIKCFFVYLSKKQEMVYNVNIEFIQNLKQMMNDIKKILRVYKFMLVLKEFCLFKICIMW